MLTKIQLGPLLDPPGVPIGVPIELLPFPGINYIYNYIYLITCHYIHIIIHIYIYIYMYIII